MYVAFELISASLTRAIGVVVGDGAVGKVNVHASAYCKPDG